VRAYLASVRYLLLRLSKLTTYVAVSKRRPELDPLHARVIEMARIDP